MSFHGGLVTAASDITGETWETVETVSGEAWDGFEATGQLLDDSVRELGGALVIDSARELTDVAGSTDEAVRDLTTPVGEGLGDIGQGGQQLLARTGAGIENTGEGIQSLGRFGGIGLSVIVVLALAVLALLYLEGDL